MEGLDTLTVIFLLGFLSLFLAYFLLDFNWFLRSIYTMVNSKYFRKKIPFLGTSTIYGIVLPTDADFFLTHMNNARVLREFDFARFDHTIRTGLARISYVKKGGGVAAAQAVRYRQQLHMFTIYKIVTTAVYYEGKSVYYEHKVITTKDDIVRCVAYCKLTFNLNIPDIVEKYYPATVLLDVPEDLKTWIEYNRLSSLRLNPNKLSKIVKNEESKASNSEESDCCLK